MLFPIKQKPEIINWLKINIKKNESSIFNEINRVFIKTESRKSQQNLLGSISERFFYYRLKQWKYFTQNIFNNTQKKTIFIYRNKNLPELQMFKKYTNFYQIASNIYSPGFLTNFHIQKKKQFKLWQPSEYTHYNEIKKNKPTLFIFFHISPKNKLAQETKHLNLPIIATENIYENQLSAFPLYLNPFKNNLLVQKLMTEYLQNKKYTNISLNNIPSLEGFKTILEWQETFFNITKNKETTTSDSFLNHEASLSADLDKIAEHYNETLNAEILKKIKRRSWKKLINFEKLITKFKKNQKKIKKPLIILKKLTKIFNKKNKIISFYFLNAKPLFCQPGFLRSYNFHKTKIIKLAKKNSFQNYFKRHNNINYLKKTYKILIGWKNKKIWKNSYWRLKWTWLTMLTLYGNSTQKNNYSQKHFLNFLEKIQNEFHQMRVLTNAADSKYCRRKIRRQKKINWGLPRFTKPFRLPSFKFFWRANSKWILKKEQKMRLIALAQYKSTKKYPIWWNFPIKKSMEDYNRIAKNAH